MCVLCTVYEWNVMVVGDDRNKLTAKMRHIERNVRHVTISHSSHGNHSPPKCIWYGLEE